jgi:hypothetical protein
LREVTEQFNVIGALPFQGDDEQFVSAEQALAPLIEGPLRAVPVQDTIRRRLNPEVWDR